MDVSIGLLDVLVGRGSIFLKVVPFERGGDFQGSLLGFVYDDGRLLWVDFLFMQFNCQK